MKIDLSGKHAIVTGSTAGIGFGIAKGLAAAGASVTINGRTQGAVDQALADLRQQLPGAVVDGVALDLGTAEGCAALVGARPSCDILINNLGIFGPQDFFEIPDSEWTRFFEVNVMSGVRLSRAYLPGMQARDWGRVVFLSSESGLNIPPDMLHYGFTKTALLSISRGLAKRMAGTGVTVNAVLPGPTLSASLSAKFSQLAKQSGRTVDEEARAFVKARRASSIIQRAASVEEVANMVVYVASPLASATTGAALRVDGGVVDTIA
ncbi:MAG: SDR family NAD(P)-dependent oxidoreductase [Janthinobacterium lividum]